MFQSSPDPKAGRNVSTPPGIAALSSSNPRPTRRSRAQPPAWTRGVTLSTSGFNPRPTRRPGATPTSYPARSCSRYFNPHPAREPDASQRRCYVVFGELCSNPRPTRRPGATRHRLHPGRPILVSILARPEGRAQPVDHPKEVSCYIVSILARPEGRAQRYQWRGCLPQALCFNPRPTRRPGATRLYKLPYQQNRCFNPRPTRRPGATAPL